MSQKREAVGELVETRQIKTLKRYTILKTFETLDLVEQQDIIPELLKIAKVVNGYALNHVSPDFIRWICSGRIKEWSQEDVERGWEMWNFLYRRAEGGSLIFQSDHHESYVWSSLVQGQHDVYLDEFQDSRKQAQHQDEIKIMARKSFFSVILKEFTPETFVIDIDEETDQDFASYMEHVELDKYDSELTFELLENPTVGYIRDLIPDPRLDSTSYPPEGFSHRAIRKNT